MVSAIKELPDGGGRGFVPTDTVSDAAAASWRVVRYVEEQDDTTALRELWKHPARRQVPRIRYAVDVDGERVAWGLRSRDAAVRWLGRLKQPVQLTVPLDELDELDDDLDQAA